MHQIFLKNWFNQLKSDNDILNIKKLKIVSVDFIKLRNVVKNDVVKKTVYDKLGIKLLIKRYRQQWPKTSIDREKQIVMPE